MHKAAQEAQQKFEYFFTGAVGAMFAYTAQTYESQKFESFSNFLEPAALLMLALAFFFGLRRLDCLYRILGMNYEELHAAANAKELSKALEQAGRSGQALSSEQEEFRKEWEAKRDASVIREKQAGVHLKTLNQKSRFFYNARNILMVCGLLTIVVAKVLEPYGTSSEQGSNGQSATAVSLKTE